MLRSHFFGWPAADSGPERAAYASPAQTSWRSHKCSPGGESESDPREVAEPSGNLQRGVLIEAKSTRTLPRCADPSLIGRAHTPPIRPRFPETENKPRSAAYVAENCCRSQLRVCRTPSACTIMCAVRHPALRSTAKPSRLRWAGIGRRFATAGSDARSSVDITGCRRPTVITQNKTGHPNRGDPCRETTWPQGQAVVATTYGAAASASPRRITPRFLTTRSNSVPGRKLSESLRIPRRSVHQ